LTSALYSHSLHDALPISSANQFQYFIAAIYTSADQHGYSSSAFEERRTNEILSSPPSSFASFTISSPFWESGIAESTIAAMSFLDRKSTRLNSSHVSI